MDLSRKFRFGAVAAFARGGGEWSATARRVEELGFSTLLCPDTTGTLAPFAALSAAAVATGTLRLGTYVLASPLRAPAAVAWETASLDVLSDGRFELGVGAGRPDSERDAARLGLPFGRAGERIAQMEATLAAVRARYSGEDPAAQHDAVRGVQRPHPPILVAGSGPRMLALAARHADSVALGLPPLSTEDDLDAKVRELRAIAGEKFDGLELNVNIALVGEDAPPHAASWFGADPKELFRVGSITALRGTPREMADTLLRRRDRTGVSYVSVNAMFAEQFAPVIELLG
ncbi:TIGR03621 family F420-dependent LLM class oxidoreductase [Actinospica sp.]|jgi:probable F420-dependent oxidoreductase|uniref:TIGR03621 family F420-dependent LLM class oxidoreductase n=1 Tax=Actinospica sp. TaxID=1872142 RepID=UPI002CD95E27|nr:TIGR03621 family F420-dependent LLM class oxidoreductase [Actinospica sp.]HWG24379.1 TIGR03621 family F420-dependent LLM class oxidoreductase [Actinospica sp.]